MLSVRFIRCSNWRLFDNDSPTVVCAVDLSAVAVHWQLVAQASSTAASHGACAGCFEVKVQRWRSGSCAGELFCGRGVLCIISKVKEH